MKKKTMEEVRKMKYKAKSSRGFVVSIKRSFKGKIGIYEVGGRKPFYFLSDRSAEDVAKRILKEMKNERD